MKANLYSFYEVKSEMSRTHSAARDLLKGKLLGRGKFPANVARSLLRCQRSESQEFGRYFDNADGGSREQLSLAVQEEQIEMLKILFSLFYADETWTPPVICNGLLYVCQNNPGRGDGSARRLL